MVHSIVAKEVLVIINVNSCGKQKYVFKDRKMDLYNIFNILWLLTTREDNIIYKITT